MEPNEEKEIKPAPYKNWSIAVFVILLAFLFVLGRELFSKFSSDNIMLFTIVTVVIGYLLNTIIYELGHLIFGKIAGYRLLEFNLFGLAFKKQQGQLKFGLSAFENIGGKTTMVPKSEKAKPILYLFGGGILYVIVSAALFAFALSSKDLGDITWGIFIIIAIGMVIIVYNLLPLRMDSYTDGFIIRMLVTRKGSVKAYHDNLLQEEALNNDIEQLKLVEYEDYANTFEAQSLIYKYYYYIHHDQFEDAEKTADMIIKVSSYLLDESIGEAYSAKAYFILMNKGVEETNKFLWEIKKAERNFISSSSQFQTMKSALGIVGLIDNNFDEYDYIMHKFDKVKDHYRYQARIEDEMKMINAVLEKIKKNNPSW